MIEKKIIDIINEKAIDKINIMEVCGTHTHELAKLGINYILNKNINIISGPGCPVCVTSSGVIDAAISLLYQDVILVTFGDMLRVKGSKKSLQDIKKDVRVIYSPIEVIDIALKNINREVVFFGVGFETTSPVIASIIKEVYRLNINNLSFLLSLKIMEPIIHKVFENNKGIDGVICPGHVASITGSDYFKFISEKYHVTCAICGFEALDILGGIYYIVNNYKEKSFINLYKRVVSCRGNEKAKNMLNEVFDIKDEMLRGVGVVKDSGYVLKNKYKVLDAIIRFSLNIEEEVSKECMCSEIIMGIKKPNMCKLFCKVCNPNNPLGPCMVSSEGACLAYYKYRR